MALLSGGQKVKDHSPINHDAYDTLAGQVHKDEKVIQATQLKYVDNKDREEEEGRDILTLNGYLIFITLDDKDQKVTFVLLRVLKFAVFDLPRSTTSSQLSL